MSYKTVGDFLKVESGFAFKSKDWQENGNKVVKIANIHDHFADMSECSFVSDEVAKGAKRFIANYHDIIVCLTGATLGEIGRLVEHEQVYINQRVGLARSKNPALDDFSYYLLRYVKSVIIALGAGSAQENISPTDIEKIEVPAFDPQEAEKIGKFLANFDLIIEHGNSLLKNLDSVLTLIYRYWFNNQTPPNSLDLKQIATLFGMPVSEINEMKKPAKFTKSLLGDIAYIDSKSINPFDEPEKLFRHYSIPAFDNSRTPSLDRGSQIKSGKYLVPEKSLLVSKLNPITPRKWLVLDSTSNSICSTEFVILKPKKDFQLSYIYFLLKSAAVQNEMVSIGIGSTGSRQRLIPDDLLRIEIDYPGDDLLRVFNSIALPILELSQYLLDLNVKLSSLRDLCIPQLYSGGIILTSK
jgi:type I restriction enzyme S subunit